MMRETSSTSSTIWVSDVTLRATVSRARARFSPVSRPDCIIRTYPTIAFSGVRSSWESVARNSSLRRLASRAIVSRRCRSSSARLRSLMSRAIFDAPTTVPS